MPMIWTSHLLTWLVHCKLPASETFSCLLTPVPDSSVTSVQVKLRGVRIELTEVEHHLSSFQGVKQALAVVHADTIQQQHLVAYLSPENIDTEQLRAHVAKFLPKQMIPESFVLLDQFPKMPNGKADRASLPEPKYADMAKADYVAPSDEVQEVVRLSCFCYPLLHLGFMQDTGYSSDLDSCNRGKLLRHIALMLRLCWYSSQSSKQCLCDSNLKTTCYFHICLCVWSLGIV